MSKVRDAGGTQRPEKANWSAGFTAEDGRTLVRVVEHYHRVFKENALGQECLASRGFRDPETLAAFRVGFADGSLPGMLNDRTRRRLRDLGIVSTTGQEALHGHVVFPLEVPGPTIVGLYGYHAEACTERLVGLPGNGIIHWQAMKSSAEVVLTGSVWDAMTLYQAGVRNVSGIVGALDTHSELLGILGRFRVRRVLLCLGCVPGTDALAQALVKAGIDSVDADFLGDESPNALLRALGREKVAQVLRDHFRNCLRSPGAAMTVSEEKASPDPQAGSPSSHEPSVTAAEGGGHLIRFRDRAYRVRGLKEHNLHQLRVNLRVDGHGRMHVETLDLYGHRSRSAWVREAGKELGVPEEQLASEVQSLIEVLEGLRLTSGKGAEGSKVEIPDRDREEALGVLRAPAVIDRILADFEKVGVVGESGTLAVGYLATVSRLLEEPLGIFVTSRSGAGKSSLQEAVCGFVPTESLVRYTQLTEKALFYKGEENLVHKVLAVDEERGAADANYSLRILQSAQRLTIGSTRADLQTGRLVTQEYTVRGPVAIFLTTASPDVLDPETRSRFVQVSVDESPEQTRRILERQRAMETLDGLVRRREAEAIRKRHHTIQRLLRPLAVVNPFAPVLAYPDDRLQMRREQKKYLTLIKAIALLHQHQREVKQGRSGDEAIEYIEVEPQDVRLANRLTREVLGQGLDDLAPHTRELLRHLLRISGVGTPVFTREEVRRRTGWSYWSVREHLAHLVRMEYVAVLSGGNGRRMTYQLLFDGDPDEGSRFLAGLVDVDEPKRGCGTLRSGDQKPEEQKAQPVPGCGEAACGVPANPTPRRGRP